MVIIGAEIDQSCTTSRHHPLMLKANEMTQAVTATQKLHNKSVSCCSGLYTILLHSMQNKKDKEREILNTPLTQTHASMLWF